MMAIVVGLVPNDEHVSNVEMALQAAGFAGDEVRVTQKAGEVLFLIETAPEQVEEARRILGGEAGTYVRRVSRGGES